MGWPRGGPPDNGKALKDQLNTAGPRTMRKHPRRPTLLMAVAWPRPAAAIKVWRSEEDGRKLLEAATTEWENSDTVNRPTRLDTQSASATPANDEQTLSSTDAATAAGRPALRAERESSKPT